VASGEIGASAVELLELAERSSESFDSVRLEEES